MALPRDIANLQLAEDAFFIAGVGAVYAAIFLSSWWHRARQRRETERTHVLQESERYSVNLVHSLSPALKVARYRFRGMQSGSSSCAAVSLQFETLGLRLKQDDRCVLEGVTGVFHAGHMAAIMGPSGAGKSTFMNVLCGKASYGYTTGKVWVNGEEHDLSFIRSVMGFVPQDDIVHEDLTVREQIFYSACLRNTAGTSRARIDRIVEDVLNVMELCEIQHSVVGGVVKRGISGGERKRVNIGLELAACPFVFFLDEPTSGLDATVAMDVVQSLKRLAETGMTVIVVVHQPRYDLFTLFDDVLLLGGGGRTVFTGPTECALPHFQRIGFQIPQHANPADWFIDIISGRVLNAHDSTFEPMMLFGLWDEGDEIVSRVTRTRTENFLSARADQVARIAALCESLEAKWDAIDTTGGQVLSKDKVAGLMVACTNAELSPEVENELFNRMKIQDNGLVNKSNFLDYVLDLTRNVACDVNQTTDSTDLEMSTRPGLRQEDLSRRKPSTIQQYLLLLSRNVLRCRRNVAQAALGTILIVVAATVFGGLSNGKIMVKSWEMPARLQVSCLAIGLLTGISCLNVFGADRPVFLRESANGISVAAFYFARVTLSFLEVQMQSIVFSAVWYYMAAPDGGFSLSYQAFRALAFSIAGWGYIVSAVVSLQNMTLAVAVIILLFGAGLSDPIAISTGSDSLPLLSPFTWTYGSLYLQIIDNNGGAAAMDLPGQVFESAFRKLFPMTSLGYGTMMQLVLLAMGVALHVLGFVALKFSHTS